jgi:hypothetical protein
MGTISFVTVRLYPKNRGGVRSMQAICVHTWNPNAPGMNEQEFLPAREKFMRNLIDKKVPVVSLQAAFNWEQGKAWCIWETDSLERLKSIMVEFPHIHTDIIPVKQAPKVT